MSFHPEYLVHLPLPIAQLYSRAHNAKDPRARHDNTFYLFEALIKLAACPPTIAYLHEIRNGGERSEKLDELLVQLSLPSLGQWVGFLRETTRWISERDDAEQHPLGGLWNQLNRKRKDLPAVLALYQRIRNGPDGEPGREKSCSLLQLFDLIVQYRNTVFGHGANRVASFYEQKMGPLLFPAASEILSPDGLGLLGAAGSQLVYIDEVRRVGRSQLEIECTSLAGLQANRMEPIQTSSNVDTVPGCVAVLWPGRDEPVRLDPLLTYRDSELSQEVLFLNRDRNRKDVEYLSYTTGVTERNRAMSESMCELVELLRGVTIPSEDLEQVQKQTLELDRANQSAEFASFLELLNEDEEPEITKGEFEVLGEVGRGAMGIVYLARQRSLGRPVALKVLPDQLIQDETAVARFRQEAAVLAKCEHPSIVKVLHSGEFAKGQPFYAMEYVSGADLERVWQQLSRHTGFTEVSSMGQSVFDEATLQASRLHRLETTVRLQNSTHMPGQAETLTDEPDEPMDPLDEGQSLMQQIGVLPLPELPSIDDDPCGGFERRVARIIRDVARGLQAVHNTGTVHRDVKPANIVLSADASRAVLMDFGLVKGQDLSLTASGSRGFLGTLRYAAPEQLASARLKVGPQADIRSLGVTMWELLARQRLFADAQDEIALAQAVHERDVPLLSTITRDIDPDLEAIVARATERSTSARIQTATELADYLDLYLDGKPVPLRTPRGLEHARRWATKHWKPIAGAAVGVVAGMAILLSLTGLFGGPEATEPEAVPVDADTAGTVIAASGEPIRVGILHSLTGTMAQSESPIVDAALLAIEELNSQGGVLGRPVEAVVKDGRSEPAVFATQTKELITVDGVCTIFGCWTSASRKSVVSVVEHNDHLLIYPLQHEGLEESTNVIYTGAAPNQQIIPAVQWAFAFAQKRRFFLVGSDYVFPRVAHEIIKDQLQMLGAELAGESFLPLGSTDFESTIQTIRDARPDVILNSINGTSNTAFFRQLRRAGIRSQDVPTISFSIGEEELRNLDTAAMAGDYAAWNYFQSVDTPENDEFVANFRQKYGPQRVITDPMQTAYFGVKLWAQAVEESQSTDASEIRYAIRNQKTTAPSGEVRIDPATQHTFRTPRIGKVLPDGQFEIVWTAAAAVEPVPYPASRTARDWQALLRDLYAGWGQQWSAPSTSRAVPIVATPSTSQVPDPPLPRNTFPATSGSRGVTDDRILLGMSAAFSGTADVLGEEMRTGIQTCFQQVNTEGGVHGRKLELISLDDGYDPKQTVEQMNALINDHKVFAIIGNVGTPTARVAVPIAVENKVPFFGAFTGSEILRHVPPERYVFNYRASYLQEIEAQVRYLVRTRKVPANRIAAFTQDDSFGDSGFQALVRSLRQHGTAAGEIIHVRYERNSLQVEEAARQLIESRDDIDAVMVVGTYRPAARLIETLASDDFHPIFSCVSFVVAETLARELTALDVTLTRNIIVTQVVPWHETSLGAIKEYREQLKRYHPESTPGTISLEGYLAASVFVEGLRQAGRNLNNDTLVNALESMDRLDVGTGDQLSFSPTIHQASDHVWAVTIGENGKCQPIVLE